MTDFSHNPLQQTLGQDFQQVKNDINLFNHLPYRARVIFSTKTMMKCFGGLIILLIVFSIFYYLQLGHATRLFTRVESNKKQLSTRFVLLQQQYPEALDIVKQNQTLMQLTDKVSVVEKVVSQLKAQVSNNQSDRQLFFQLLAEQIMPGVWLTQIDIEQQGTSVSLQGHAYYAKTVLAFMGRLNQAALPHKVQFYLYHLEKNDKGLLNFELRTREGQSPDEIVD